jgi:hypothetical protein
MREHFEAQRELEKIIEIGHRHMMYTQEGHHQALTNRVNMFGCKLSLNKLQKCDSIPSCSLVVHKHADSAQL